MWTDHLKSEVCRDYQHCNDQLVAFSIIIWAILQFNYFRAISNSNAVVFYMPNNVVGVKNC